MKTTHSRVYAGWPGTGKSYLCDKSPDVYSEVECWKFRSGDFPDNYTKAIVDKIENNKILFVSSDPIVLADLDKLGVSITLILPDPALRNEYLDRYIDRDSPYEFIGTMMKHWRIWLEALLVLDYCEIVVLNSGEFIETFLSETNEKQAK
ncbi:MAG: hypothetical protein PVJ39_04880 [Gammaproteobacteria bacterium]